MKIVDANLLIYAINRDAPHHGKAKDWLEEAIAGPEPVGLAWIVVLAFLRITSNDRILPNPLTTDRALAIIDGLFDLPTVRMISPTGRHWEILKELIEPLGSAGNLTSDAHLAALSIEHSARLYSTDNDFGRFRGVRWINPIGK